jgi:hypothetical protein
MVLERYGIPGLDERCLKACTGPGIVQEKSTNSRLTKPQVRSAISPGTDLDYLSIILPVSDKR